MISATEAAKISEAQSDKMFKRLTEETIPGQCSVGNREVTAKRLTEKQCQLLRTAGYTVEELLYSPGIFMVGW